MMGVEDNIALYKPLMFYALFWITLLMFFQHFGILDALLGVNIPPIAVPYVGNESVYVATENRLYVGGYEPTNKNPVSFVIVAEAKDENVGVVVLVDDIPELNFSVPRGRQVTYPVSFNLPEGEHVIKVRLIKDGNTIIDEKWQRVVITE